MCPMPAMCVDEKGVGYRERRGDEALEGGESGAQDGALEAGAPAPGRTARPDSHVPKTPGRRVHKCAV